ncbi:DNA-binding transcriptional MerR regulator [Alkalihalobacillus xiaoxiensis]|uniref:DNA-binding transcriptional MerR regulator n=1 Tax=Shouchella xiaoxiensis TaxID=766895 RepID=A0ABS2SVK2_9BACI|nr:MerR family transcriptional regulator [Shouchella xiaoxiensis]MBM7839270.1 DNA-binding transcriptional MerR regulator [Shouchella xiaoxiensis]
MLTIGELAKKSGVTTRTLRHYDAIHLLTPDKLSEGKHRLYCEESVLTLAKIQLFKRMGFSLKRMKPLLELQSSNVLEEQLRVVKREQEKLKEMEETINGLLHIHKIEGQFNWHLLLELIKKTEDPVKELDRLQFILPKLCDDSNETKSLLLLINHSKSVDQSNLMQMHDLGSRLNEWIGKLCGGDERLIKELYKLLYNGNISATLGCYPIPAPIVSLWKEATSCYY